MNEILCDFLQSPLVYVGYRPKNLSLLISAISLHFPLLYRFFSFDIP